MGGLAPAGIEILLHLVDGGYCGVARRLHCVAERVVRGLPYDPVVPEQEGTYEYDDCPDRSTALDDGIERQPWLLGGGL